MAGPPSWRPSPGCYSGAVHFLLELELSAPVALEKGQRLSLRAQRSLGMGVVPALLD